jgi:hypothetical protein
LIQPHRDGTVPYFDAFMSLHVVARFQWLLAIEVPIYDLPLAATFGRERLRDPDVLLPFWDQEPCLRALQHVIHHVTLHHVTLHHATLHRDRAIGC